MKKFLSLITAVSAGIFALGAANASANGKPGFCDFDHDHRSHTANYYDHYKADKYYKAGPYQRSSVSFSIRVGDRYDPYTNRNRYNNSRTVQADYGRRNGYRGASSRVLKKQTYDTRHRAKILLVEEVVYNKRRPNLVCTVKAVGPDARYVSNKRIKFIAKDKCSYNARINLYS